MNIHCGNLSSELLLLLLFGKWSPLFPILCSFIYHFLSPSHRVSGCVNNESIFWGGFFDCRWGAEVTAIRGSRSLSAIPRVCNNSLTYHFFSWVWERSSLWWQISILCHMIDYAITIMLAALHYNEIIGLIFYHICMIALNVFL